MLHTKPALILLIAFIIIELTLTATYGQDRQITGRALDFDTRKPIKNANIIILGTTSGTISNHLGYFALTVDVSKHKSIVVSHVGYKTSEVPLPEADNFKFFIKKEFVLLNEINLTNYPVRPSAEEVSGSQARNDGLGHTEVSATFPGGMDRFYEYVGNALASPEHRKFETPLVATFAIDEKGRAAMISASDSTHELSVALADAVVKSPTWIPAMQGAGTAEQYFRLPIINKKFVNIDLKSLRLSDFYKFLGEHTKYPAQARRMGIEGVTYLHFSVDSAGHLLTSEMLKDIGADCGTEVKRVMATVPPELNKALRDQTGYSQFILPVTFGLEYPYKTKNNISYPGSLLLSELSIVAMGMVTERRATGAPRGFNGITFEDPLEHLYNSLPEALESPRSVRKLSLMSLGLTEFPKEIVQLKNLELLSLEDNQLKTLPPEIGELKDLKELYLLKNNLERVPIEMAKLGKLKLLDMAFNQLTSFPAEITLLEDLMAIDLSNNQITSLPGNIGNLKNLKILALQNNPIKELPEEFFKLKKLEKVFLKGTALNNEDLERLKVVFKKAEIIY